MKWEYKMKILNDAVNKFGTHAQLGMVVEECAELIADVNRYFRERIEEKKLIEEMVDVGIMIDQMRVIFGGEIWDDIEDIKLKKLEKLINNPSN